MDATVEQTDGYRFFYMLPLQAQRVLIEDTYYSDTPELNFAHVRRAIMDYARSRRITIVRVLREETGVLPLPGRTRAPARIDRRHLIGGYSGGWFHPTTGYSLPLAVRFATEVATSPLEHLEANLERLSIETARQQRYCVLLNRLLFDGFSPNARVPVFERFYRMPLSAILHFYALQLSPTDRVRLLCGRPPPGLNPRRAIFRFREQRRERLTQGETA
jgi:lycopene beta-cyclase